MIFLFIRLFFALGGIVFFGTRIARYCEVITRRTRFGRAVMGGVFLAGVTSLPELVATVAALKHLDTPSVDLLFGDIFGSNLFNLTISPALMLFFPRTNILSRVPKHSRDTAMHSLWLTAAAVTGLLFFRQASLLLPLLYAYAFYRISQAQSDDTPADDASSSLPERYMTIPLRNLYIRTFGSAVGVMIFGLWVVSLCDELSRVTGWGMSFVGTIFLALATSMPEIVTTYASLRVGAGETALGNIFGSNLFNLLLIFLGELLTDGSIFSSASRIHLVTLAPVFFMTWCFVTPSEKWVRFRARRIFPPLMIMIYLVTQFLVFLLSHR